MQAVVLAGGLGTRMQAYGVPKALIPVRGKPFLERQMGLLASGGVDRFVFCLGYKGAQIEEAGRRLAPQGTRVDFVYDGDTPLGTGGALRRAFDAGVLDGEFFLTYGDSYLPVDYRSVWQSFRQSTADVLMTVLKNAGRWDRSNVWMENASRARYDKAPSPELRSKMEHIDYGLMGWRRDTVASSITPGTKVDLADILKDLGARSRIEAYQVRERFYEIGCPEGLRDLEEYLLREESAPPHGSLNERKDHDGNEAALQH
jgi:NDP-sugar pyrophosphorylase family protein